MASTASQPASRRRNSGSGGSDDQSRARNRPSTAPPTTSQVTPNSHDSPTLSHPSGERRPAGLRIDEALPRSGSARRPGTLFDLTGVVPFGGWGLGS